MPLEIERKFLVRGDFKPYACKQEFIKQAYISTDPKRSVRIRRKGEKAYITIKGIGNGAGISRLEWEKEISLAEAEELFSICLADSIIEKNRYYIKAGTLIFEVDEFYGNNQGLTIAEIELPEENFPFEKPSWLGEEVTGNIKYYNSHLTQYPYSSWNRADD